MRKSIQVLCQHVRDWRMDGLILNYDARRGKVLVLKFGNLGGEGRDSVGLESRLK